MPDCTSGGLKRRLFNIDVHAFLSFCPLHLCSPLYTHALFSGSPFCRPKNMKNKFATVHWVHLFAAIVLCMLRQATNASSFCQKLLGKGNTWQLRDLGVMPKLWGLRIPVILGPMWRLCRRFHQFAWVERHRCPPYLTGTLHLVVAFSTLSSTLPLIVATWYILRTYRDTFKWGKDQSQLNSVSREVSVMSNVAFGAFVAVMSIAVA